MLAFLFRCFIQITPEENMKSWQKIPEFGSLFPDGFPLSISKISQPFFFSLRVMAQTGIQIQLFFAVISCLGLFHAK